VSGPDHFFVNKSDEALCALFSEFAMKQGRSLFIDGHLRNDALIMAGFAGDAGGARKPPDKPSMSQGEFIKLGEDWYDKGQHACNLLGTISLKESVTATDTVVVGPIKTVTQIAGTRTVEVSFRPPKYHAKITTDYTLTETSAQPLVSPKTGKPCFITHVRKHRQTGTTSDTAHVAIKDTIFYGDTEFPQTDYRIDVWLPPETTQMTETRTVQDGCGLPVVLPPVTESKSFTWGRAFFVLEGHVQDPKSDVRAGACDRDALSTDINTDNLRTDKSLPCLRWKNMGASWYLGLMQRTMPTTFASGKAIPYHLNANWNLAYTK
jgi:hypothetical protein